MNDNNDKVENENLTQDVLNKDILFSTIMGKIKLSKEYKVIIEEEFNIFASNFINNNSKKVFNGLCTFLYIVFK